MNASTVHTQYIVNIHCLSCILLFCTLLLSLSSISSLLPFLIGEVQTVLSIGFSKNDTVFTGTFSGDIYQWKGHTLDNVIKSAHNVCLEYHLLYASSIIIPVILYTCT